MRPWIRRFPFLAGLPIALLFAPAPATAQEVATGPSGAVHDSTSHGWRETWRVELSRGIGTPAVWVDSLLLVASLDRNAHLLALREDGAEVVWDENFRGGFEASPLVTEDRIYLPETRRGKRLVALDRHRRTTGTRPKSSGPASWRAPPVDRRAAPRRRGPVGDVSRARAGDRTKAPARNSTTASKRQRAALRMTSDEASGRVMAVAPGWVASPCYQAGAGYQLNMNTVFGAPSQDFSMISE